MFFDIVSGAAHKIQETDYYAFGLDIQHSLSGAENKYQYNGKEKQDQERTYDYGARFYDPVIGRWSVIDQKSELYFGWSPYIYALNTPLNAVDPNGHLVIFVNGMHGFGDTKAKYWSFPSKNRPESPNASAYDNYAFDESIMNVLKDHKARYYDGSLGGILGIPENLNAEFREAIGERVGERDVIDIITSLKRSNGVIVENIKIVTHSMGSAFAKGLIKAIIEYAEKHPEETAGLSITEYDFAPFNSSNQSVIKKGTGGVMEDTFIFQNKNDRVAGSKRMKQSKGAYNFEDIDKDRKHSIADFTNVVDLLTWIVQQSPGDYEVRDGFIYKL